MKVEGIEGGNDEKDSIGGNEETSTDACKPNKQGEITLEPMSLYETFVACVTLFIIVGSFQIVALIVSVCFVWWYYTRHMLPWTILLALFSTVLIPANYSETFVNLFVWKYVHKYFGYEKVNLTALENVKCEKKYMLIEYPHGSFPIATILIATFFDDHYLKYKSVGRTARGLSATVLDYIPLVRHLFAMVGSLPATKKNFLRAFEIAGACSVLPGGIAEMFMVDKEKERIYFKKRYGYIKVALEKGVDMLPVYHFGNSQVLSILGRTGLLKYVSRKLKVSIMLPYGRFGLPIPFRHKIVTVVGEPISVPQTSNPSHELIQEYQTKLEQAFFKMYEDHKHLVGWENRPLSIE